MAQSQGSAFATLAVLRDMSAVALAGTKITSSRSPSVGHAELAAEIDESTDCGSISSDAETQCSSNCETSGQMVRPPGRWFSSGPLRNRRPQCSMLGGEALVCSFPLDPIPGTPVTAPLQRFPLPSSMLPPPPVVSGPVVVDVLAPAFSQTSLTAAPSPVAADPALLLFAPPKIASTDSLASMDSMPSPPPGLTLSTGQDAAWNARTATLQLAKRQAVPLKVRLPPHLEHARLDLDPMRPAKKSLVYAEFGAGSAEFTQKIDVLLPLKKRVPSFLLENSQGATGACLNDIPR